MTRRVAIVAGGTEPDWETLLKYNHEDVLATKFVLDKLIQLEEKELP